MCEKRYDLSDLDCGVEAGARQAGLIISVLEDYHTWKSLERV